MFERTQEVRVEDSVREYLSSGILDLLDSEEPVLVSGQPLMVVSAKVEVEITRFRDCELVVDEAVLIWRVFHQQKIPYHGHRHLEERFLGAYDNPAVQCFNFQGDEIMLGITDALGFKVKRETGISYTATLLFVGTHYGLSYDLVNDF